MTAGATRWQPPHDDDDAIASALEAAYVPLLMVSLVHLTGDPSILRGAIRPDATFGTFLGEPQGGISERGPGARSARSRSMRCAHTATREAGCRLRRRRRPCPR